MKRISQLPKRDRNLILLQVLVCAAFGAVTGCVISYYLIF
jgi:predicted lysophospholipase L1 biosynthesis ABC-type transport system permease subunit